MDMQRVKRTNQVQLDRLQTDQQIVNSYLQFNPSSFPATYKHHAHKTYPDMPI